MVEETQAPPGGAIVRPSVRPAEGLRRLPLAALAFWLALLAVLIFIPWVFDDVWLNNFNQILAAIVAVTGLNLLVGYTGQVSLGHAAFAMIGAFTLALMYDHWPELRTNPYPLYAPLPAAGLSGLVAGAVCGVPSLRV